MNESKAQDLFDRAFNAKTRRGDRSMEYKKGVLDALKCRAGEITQTPLRYAPGSVKYDAWRAGVTEGRQIWASQEENDD